MAAGTSLYALPRIPYLRLAFVLRAVAPAVLPAYKGSMLRGGSCRLRRECVVGKGATFGLGKVEIA
jgi:hypothetical protein